MSAIVFFQRGIYRDGAAKRTKRDDHYVSFARTRMILVLLKFKLLSSRSESTGSPITSALTNTTFTLGEDFSSLWVSGAVCWPTWRTRTSNVIARRSLGLGFANSVAQGRDNDPYGVPPTHQA